MSLRQTYRRATASIKQEQDDDSDTEDSHLELLKVEGLESQIIHSGHFMVSWPHSEHPPKKGYDFDTVNKQTCQTYHFGKMSTSHLSIDASLTKLFECMTLAYSGKLVSPKWKNFKGLKLLWRDKIRLNNAIWRAWYMQYVEKRENPVCHFVTPLDGNMHLDVHRAAENIASDGRCWKRRIEIVIREYHKWRTYFKKRLHKHKDDDLSSLLTGPEEQLSLFGEISPDVLRVSFCQDEESAARRLPRKHNETPAPMEMDPLFDMDVLMSEFSDTLFSTLASHQPLAWPNPREIAHAGNADMIQPGLIPLQPNLDFMDSCDPLQDLFHSLRQPAFPSVFPTSTSVTLLPSSSAQSQASLMPALNLSVNHPSGSLPMSSHMTTRRSETSVAGYEQNCMPLFARQVASSNQSVVSSESLSREPLVQCLQGQNLASATTIVSSPLNNPSTLDENITASVTTHMAPSTVTSSNVTTTTTISHISNYNSMSTQPPPLPSQLRPLASLTSGPIQQRQSFALPHPLQSKSAIKVRPRQKIAPTTSHLIFTAPFPGHASAVLVTPPNLKPDVVSANNSLVIAASHPGTASGFHVLPQTQKTPQLMVPKENPYSPSSKNQNQSPGAVHSQPGSSQGSPCGLDQVPSPPSLMIGSTTFLTKSESNQSRRTTHISAEQKRRSNINIGFKTLCNLVPTLKTLSNVPNATTLQKTVEHISKLQQERQQIQEEIKKLREEIEELNTSISACQEQLPATGVPMRDNRLDHIEERFSEYVKSNTFQNWKFWIFSIIIKPLFESFNSMVTTTSKARLCQTTLQWLDCHCSLPVLRPMVLSRLRHLSTTTSILSHPLRLPDEAIKAVTNTDV